MKIFLAVIITAGILTASGVSSASSYSDDFNDGIMNPALWNYSIEGNPTNTDLYESSGVLNFIAAGSPEFSSRHYLSTFAFSLDEDFAVRADFNFPLNTADSGGVELGLFKGDFLSSESFFAAIDAASDSRDGGNVFGMGMYNPPALFYENNIIRTTTTGWLGITYTSSADLLEFKAFDTENNLVAYGVYPNFKNLGTEPWRVFIGGYSDGAVLAEGPANLDNFQAEVVPEPASMILFLSGAVAFAAKRFCRNLGCIKNF